MSIHRVKTKYIALGLAILVIIIAGIFGYRYTMANKIYGQAIEQEEHGFKSQAKKGYLKVISLNPRQADANYQLGLIYEKEGNIQEAIKYIDRALKLDSNNPDFNLGMGFLYFNHFKDPTKAQSYFSKAYSQDPGNFYACFMLGRVEESKHNIKRAIHYYTQTTKLNPRMVDAYRHLAFLYDTQDELDKAKACWEQVLKLHPEDKEAKSYLESAF